MTPKATAQKYALYSLLVNVHSVRLNVLWNAFEIYMTAYLRGSANALNCWVVGEVSGRWDDVEWLEGTVEEMRGERQGKEKTETTENKSKLLLLYSVG